MKLYVATALAAILVPVLPIRAQSAATTAASKGALTVRAAVDALSPAELDEVVTTLKDNYVQPEAVDDAAQRRAMVQGLLERLAPGAVLVEGAPPREVVAASFRAEIIEGRIGYVRLGAINPGNVGGLDATLEKFAASQLPAVVLDLRATPAGSDFEQTAEICRRFCPKGKVLFSVKKPALNQEQVLTSKDDPKFRGIVAVLVDRETAGNAEVVAAVLRTHIHALVIGGQTRGEAAEFSEFPLGSGKLLRVAVAQVALPQGPPIFPGGVKPDLMVDVPLHVTHAVLSKEMETGVTGLVLENERPRMNEAALIAGTNPEMEAARGQSKPRAEEPAALRDVALQRAIDFITTVLIYEKKPAGK